MEERNFSLGKKMDDVIDSTPIHINKRNVHGTQRERINKA